MLTLNRFQKDVLDFINLENSTTLCQFICEYQREKALQEFYTFLPRLIAGDPTAYSIVKKHLPALERFAAKLSVEKSITNPLPQFLQTIEELTNIIEKGATFSPLDSNQQTAIDCLTSKEFIQFLADIVYLYPKNCDDIQKILKEIQNIASTGMLTKKIYDKIYYAYYRLASVSVWSKNRLILARNKDYLFYTLLSTFLKPTLLERFLGFFMGIITGGLIKPLAHNPLYHFLQLFHTSNKDYHLKEILFFPALPFYLLWTDCINGAYNGARSLAYNFNYLSKHHNINLAIISLLILNAAIAACLVALFVPPVIPLLTTSIPVLQSLSLPLLITTIGLATVSVLTTITAIGVSIRTCSIPSKTTKKDPITTVPTNSTLPDTSTSNEALISNYLSETASESCRYQKIFLPTFTEKGSSGVDSQPLPRCATL